MPRHNLTAADQLFYGNSQTAAKFDSKRGIPMHPVTFVDLGAPITLDADGLVAAATSTELPNATTTTYTYATGGTSPLDGANQTGVLDKPRNITVAVTHGSSIVAMTILVSGLDENNVAMSELLTITATGTSKTAAGKKAFKKVTSIAITSASDATANTLDLGWGDVLGLQYLLTDKNYVIYLMDGVPQATGTIVAAVTTSPATTTTGDVRGTITPATATNGTRKYAAWMIGVPVADRSDSATSAYGVTQA
jgi:hypothetical protein